MCEPVHGSSVWALVKTIYWCVYLTLFYDTHRQCCLTDWKVLFFFVILTSTFFFTLIPFSLQTSSFLFALLPLSEFSGLWPKSPAAWRRTCATCLRSSTRSSPPRPSSTSSTKSCCHSEDRRLWQRNSDSAAQSHAAAACVCGDKDPVTVAHGTTSVYYSSIWLKNELTYIWI